VTEAELEAVVRRELTGVASTACRFGFGVPATIVMNRAADAIRSAARAYALAEYGVTADRRAVLEAAVAPKGRRSR